MNRIYFMYLVVSIFSVNAFAKSVPLANCLRIENGVTERVAISFDPSESKKSQVFLSLKGLISADDGDGNFHSVKFDLKDGAIANGLVSGSMAKEFGYDLMSNDFVLRFASGAKFDFPAEYEMTGMPYGSPQGMAFMFTEKKVHISDLDLVEGDGSTSFYGCTFKNLNLLKSYFSKK